MCNRDQVIADCLLIQTVLTDCSVLDKMIEQVNEEVAIIAKMVNDCVRDNATKAQSQEEYNNKYNNLVKRYEAGVAKLNKLNAERNERLSHERELRIYIESLRDSPLVLENWDDQLWTLLVLRGTVYRNGSIEFEFKNGSKILVEAE